MAPSTELRRWYNHDPGKWDEFKRRYYAELSGNADAVVQIADYLDRGPVTLLFGTREAHYNNAVALKEYLESWQKDGE